MSTVNEDEEIDARINNEMANRGLNTNSKKLTDAIKPGRQKKTMRSVDEDFEAIKEDKEKMRADAPEEFTDTYELDDEARENAESEAEQTKDDEDTGYETGETPLDISTLGNAAILSAGNKGPNYRKLMLEMNEQQAKDTAYWAVKNVIKLNPIKWEKNNPYKPIKWKYEYKRQEIKNAKMKEIEAADTDPTLTLYEKHKRLAFLYFGVPEKDFDDQDAELWRIIIRAQRYRSEFSFR